MAAYCYVIGGDHDFSDPAKSVLEQKKSERDYRKKEYSRIVDLVKKGDVEERLADEEHDHYLSAEGSVHSAEAGIETSEAQIAEASAKLEQAKADLKAAEAGVKVSEANLELAQVFVAYTRIVSPFDGVITDRGDAVHPGTFIRSAAEGTSEPLLTVSRDDKMRTIVLVPDRDVPYCKVGQIATVELDALAGRVFKAPVSRIADSETDLGAWLAAHGQREDEQISRQCCPAASHRPCAGEGRAAVLPFAGDGFWPGWKFQLRRAGTALQQRFGEWARQPVEPDAEHDHPLL